MKTNLMKWRNIFLSLMAVCAFAACSDDDEFALNTSQISEAPDFVDARDGHVYRCIRVGNQIWMAENLAYFLPGGAADGCITWGEKQDIKPEDIAVDTTNITVIISDEKYAEIYMSVVNDPNHDWQAEAGVSNALLGMFLSNFYIPYGQTRFTETMAYYKAFYDVLIVKLEAERQAQRQDYIDRIIAEKAQIPITHRDKAEASNGGYVADNGYLYSYEGAAKAVPEEGGWRVPTDADWQKLETALGMSPAESSQLNAWRGYGLGYPMSKGGSVGFDVVMSGCQGYQRTNADLFINKGDCAYFWTSDKSSYSQEEDDEDNVNEDGSTNKITVVYETAIIRQFAIYKNAIWRGTSRLDNKYRNIMYSVRLVRDAE